MPDAAPVADLPATVTRRREPTPEHPEPLAQATLCAVCPKLCRPTCPVQRATGRESVAPWRISATVRDASRTQWTTDAATTAASCTGCGACAQACLVGTNLPEESRAARAAAVTAGVLLPAAAAVAARIAETGSPRGPDEHGAHLALGADPEASTALFFGCTVQRHAPAVGEAARRLFAAAREPVRCASDEPCCGAVALDLGLASVATALARRAAESLSGAGRVVPMSPGCARMMRDEWPRLGITGPPVVTPVEWLDTALAAGRLVRRPDAVPVAVAWHDPCTLTRGLGVVETPRRVLAALGVEMRTPAASGADTRCSGGGAGYPLVDPAGAAQVAAARRAELLSLGAPTYTACPEAARQLGGPGDVRDLLELAAERVTGR